MIIPSVDIQNGSAVQLVGGKKLEIDAGDPTPILEKFGNVGEVAVIDLDAAMSHGSNAPQIKTLLSKAKCRVGGGIRSVDAAINWLDAGAAKVILGTAATPEVLSQLPRERVIAALDAVHDNSGNSNIVDQGWKNKTGQNVLGQIAQLREFVGGFLITFVEREGRLQGIDRNVIDRYVAAAGNVPVTIAGGVSSALEIAELDACGADAQVGMAIYTGKVSLAEAFCAPLKSDRPDGLWPTVVVNEMEQALGLAYSSLKSVHQSLETGLAHFWSRKRGLWKKGESSGELHPVVALDLDCDKDALRMTVKQSRNGFCHLNQTACFGTQSGIAQLQATLNDRLKNAPADSYVRKLFSSENLLREKIMEEAIEFVDATDRNDVIHEAADVIFFTIAKLAKTGVAFSDVERELDRRSLKVTRRSKPFIEIGQ